MGVVSTGERRARITGDILDEDEDASGDDLIPFVVVSDSVRFRYSSAADRIKWYSLTFHTCGC